VAPTIEASKHANVDYSGSHVAPADRARPRWT